MFVRETQIEVPIGSKILCEHSARVPVGETA